MTNPYRAELQLLFDAAESFTEPALGHHRSWTAALDRARALLAQPVAEGPTDEEIEEWADACSEAPLEEMDPEVHGWRRCFTAKEFSETIRAAIARWGRLTPQPVAEGPTDEEIMELMPQQMRDDLAAAARAMIGVDSPKVIGACRVILNRHAVNHARAVLDKWGNQ